MSKTPGTPGHPGSEAQATCAGLQVHHSSRRAPVQAEVLRVCKLPPQPTRHWEEKTSSAAAGRVPQRLEEEGEEVAKGRGEEGGG